MRMQCHNLELDLRDSTAQHSTPTTPRSEGWPRRESSYLDVLSLKTIRHSSMNALRPSGVPPIFCIQNITTRQEQASKTNKDERPVLVVAGTVCLFACLSWLFLFCLLCLFSRKQLPACRTFRACPCPFPC